MVKQPVLNEHVYTK